jgi:hypothetical protein
MKKLMIFCGMFLWAIAAQSQIIAGEYFWDTDPGIGFGIPINPSQIAGGVVDETFEIDAFAPSISTGKHTLYVRFKESDSLWSQAVGMDVLIGIQNLLSGAQNYADTARVISSEYFWDKDSTNISVAPISNYDSSFVFESSFTAVNMSPGNHTVSYRVKDKFGFLSHWTPVNILLLPGTPGISKVEYWVDNGAVVPKTEANLTPTMATDTEARAEIPTTGLANGTHILNLKVKAADQILEQYSSSDSSALYQVTFLVDPQYALSAGQSFKPDNSSSDYFCLGGKIKIPISQTGNWLSQNAFKLQLSDSSGNNFTDITTLINTPSDTLIGDIPMNIPAGIHYRIRAVSSYPYIASLSISELKIGLTVTPTTGNANPCEGSAVFFNVSSSQPAAYSWTGPAGFSAIGSGVDRLNLQLNHSGVYTVTATSSLSGCTASSTIMITVKPKPTLSASSNSPICEGQTLQLNSSSGNGGIFVSWLKITPTQTLISNTTANHSINNVTLADSGKYQVTYQLNGCVKRDTLNVKVKPNPVISITSTNAPICEGQNLVVNATATAGSSLAWSGPNSFANSNSAWSISNVTIASSGTYSLSVTLDGCTSSTTVLNVVNPTPTVNTTSPVAVCVGSPLQFAVNTTSGATYGWSGPSGFSSIIEDPLVSNTATVGMNGTYSVAVTLGSCSANGTIAVTVNPNPVLVITNQNTTGNGPVDITVPAATAGSTLPPSTSLSYYTNSLATNVLASPAAVANSGTYYIKATSPTGCIDVKPIVVNICGSTFNLVSPTDDYSSGLQVKTSTVKITASNKITGSANVTYRSAQAIELSPGFLAENGTVFWAENGTCN